MQMTSIREQVSWVVKKKDQATEKAKAMVSGAVARVRHQQPLEPEAVEVLPTTLVVGGGIAGLQASLELAEAGYPVYVVEREPSIGGHMAQFDKTFPTLDCAACILTPRMSEVAQQENINLLTYSELEEVTGSVGNFHVKIRKKARGIHEPDCTGCGLCEEKCPAKVIDDNFDVGLGHRKAVYMQFPQALPRIPVIDRDNCIWFERGKCGACKKLCPTGAIDFDQEDEVLELDVGNIVLATGYKVFDPRNVPQYGYGRLANVFTSLEFERMCNASGPTNGQIVLRDGKTRPESIAVVHCVGSRDRNHNPYCSNVCCMSALKFGHLAMEKAGAKVTSFYIDMRTTFKDYDEFYQRLLEEGMTFVRGKVAEVTDAARLPGEEGKLIVQAEDTLLGRQRRIPFDMVVLMCALEPQEDAKQMGIRCGIPCSASGWFSERHPKLDPVATMTDGIFVAGVCQGPKDIPASVAQGAAAAARVQGMIARGQVLIEPVVATIHEENCSGCRICNSLCPFSAIEYVAEQEVSRVAQELCRGCGTCVAACPAQAITGAHFDNDQVLAEIEGLLWDAGPRPAPETGEEAA
jgi:heterodisulfide reductase subunit A